MTIESSGWKLAGDLVLPATRGPHPAVILLNKAAGDRKAYQSLAARLADRGVASLRLDLRGHGESVNKGKFVPFDPASLELLEGTDEDVTAAVTYLKTLHGIDSHRIGFVGASYSGEAMALAARKSGYGQAYVALSPGSFSEESIKAIDVTGIPWLLIKSADERAPSLKEFHSDLRQWSRGAGFMEVSGTAHATDILASHPEMTEIIAVWLKGALLR